LLGALAAAHAADKKPNIVVMMADNLGYGDLGIYGGLRAPTPRIDRLARANGAGQWRRTPSELTTCDHVEAIMFT
jgi:Sulfatase